MFFSGSIPLVGPVKQLLRALDECPPDTPIEFTGRCASDAIAVLHTFLRYLPVPITGSSFASAVVKLCWESSADMFTSFSIARLLLQMLPPICFHSIVYVFSFLSQIPKATDNQIDYSTLSIFFAPALLGTDGIHPPELSAETLKWFLENWGEISVDILKLEIISGPAINATDAACLVTLRDEEDQRGHHRRLSRTGADSFPKLATIEDVSVADSSDLSGRVQNKSMGPHSNVERDTIHNTAQDSDSDGYMVIRPSTPAMGHCTTIPTNMQHSELLRSEGSRVTILEKALYETQEKVAKLEALNEEQANQLNSTRSALAEAQRESLEAHLQLQAQNSGTQINNKTDIGSNTSLGYLEEELASAREERDIAIDIIETIKGALKI